jgi:hypothetical protein
MNDDDGARASRPPARRVGGRQAERVGIGVGEGRRRRRSA